MILGFGQLVLPLLAKEFLRVEALDPAGSLNFENMTALEIIGLIACILIGLPLAIVLLVALGFGLYMLYIGFTDGFGINATL